MKRFENKQKSKEPRVVVPRAKMIHPSIMQYDNSTVQSLWEDSISLGIPFTDPFESTNLSSYRKTMLLQKRRIYVAKKSKDHHGSKSILLASVSNHIVGN